MGGRLTEFDRVEVLTLTGGRARPVYGAKASAVPIAAIGSHLPDNAPVWAASPWQKKLDVGTMRVTFDLYWNLINASSYEVGVDYRIRLNRRRGGGIFTPGRGDENWFEYQPGKGVTKDIVSEKTSGQHQITTWHGASKTTQGKPLNLPPGEHPLRLGFSIPGSGVSSTMTKFWADRGHQTFNLLVAVYQLTVDAPIKLAEHEFKDMLELGG